MTLPDPAGLRIVFLGTPEFAVPSLRTLARHVTIAAVLTQPDRPAGRGRRLTSPPVALAAKAMGLPLLQPESLKSASARADLEALRPDLLVVVAYGRIIPAAVLSLAALGGINVHPSLLPAYRGASPVQAAIADGAAVTGVTIMHLAHELDAGDIILQRRVEIGAEETAGELEERLAHTGADLLVEVVNLLVRGEAPRRPQNQALATYVGKVTKADGEIRWNRPAAAVVNHVRAMNPWPCAYTAWRGGTLRVWRAAVAELPEAAEPGRVLVASGESLVVAAAGGAVALLEVQPEAGRRMTVGEFLRGRAVAAGDRLGMQEG
jgi:methionyl-tRNA formyltransferase